MKKIIYTILLLTVTANCLFAQDYVVRRIQLPFSNEAKDYQVKKIGLNYVLNGDVIVGSDVQYTRGYMAQASGGWSYIWPKGYIPVRLDASLSKNMEEFTNRKLSDNAINAISSFNNLTRAKIKPHTDEKDYIRIQYSPDTTYGGLSAVGRQGGEQILWITRKSNVSTVLHELMHAIGFWHEQNRYDRDQFIKILDENIQDEWKYAFQLESGSPTSTYDKESIMHYKPYSFSKNGKVTLACKSGNSWSECNLGNNAFSNGDIQSINSIYFFNASLAGLNYEQELQGNKMKSFAEAPVGSIERVADKPIADGLYKIKVNRSGRYLSIDGASKDNGATLIQWDYLDQTNQKFYVRKQDDGYYVISAMNSSRYLNAAGQSKANGTAIIQWDYVNQDNLKWKIYYTKDDNGNNNPGWVIENKGSATPMRLRGSIVHTNNGEPIIIHSSDRQDAGSYDPTQKFTFERIGDLPMTDQLKTGAPMIKSQNMKSPAIKKAN